MPWHIENDNPKCNGWAVVKDDDGEIEGCHLTEAAALAQMAALYASEGRSMENRAGRVLSNKNEGKLREALAALTEVLAQLDSGDEINNLRGLAGGFEQRTVGIGDVEVRADAEIPTIRGYAAVFNRMSQPLGNFMERIAPGAFADSLASDVRALWQHDTSRVLGRTKNGTLKIWEDERGLGFEVMPPDTQDGRDALALIARGDVDQMSFGFTVPNGGDSWQQDGGMPVRTLNRVNLIEVSPVTFPAYLDTSAQVLRTAPDWVQRALHPGVDDKRADELTRARDYLQQLRIRLEKLK
jgi:HK97 family phage prohead protease